ncbi:MAG: hypothetical protein ABGX04_04260 [Myxococcales bacterium]
MSYSRVLIRRGPWEYLDAARSQASRADIVIEALTDLLPGLKNFGMHSSGKA